MSSWFNHAIERAQTIAAERADHKLVERLDALRWPTRKTESWRYTSLHAMAEQQFKSSNKTASSEQPIENLASLDIVFDGVEWLVPSDSEAGLTIESKSSLSPKKIKPEHHFFGTLNDALATDSLRIEIAANTTILRPIRLVIIGSDQVEQHAKLNVTINTGAKATIIEHLQGHGDGLSTLFSEFDVADHAHLEHYRLQTQSAAHFSIGGAHVRLNNHSSLNSHIVAFGAKIARLDIDVEHAGMHAFAKLNAIYLLKDQEHFDLHTVIEHAMPHGTTEENVRGIVADKSKATFNGRIHIHRDAQKTLAELNNRNLLMSRAAEINTKPELEIYADDVKCAHGATVAEIDEESIYYLMSRGLSKQNATIMLNFGFINELVDQMPNETIAEWLRPLLRERFAKMAK